MVVGLAPSAWCAVPCLSWAVVKEVHGGLQGIISPSILPKLFVGPSLGVVSL